MGRAGLAPVAAEFPRTAGKTRPHIGVAECKDRTFFIDAFRGYKAEAAVAVEPAAVPDTDFSVSDVGKTVPMLALSSATA